MDPRRPALIEAYDDEIEKPLDQQLRERASSTSQRNQNTSLETESACPKQMMTSDDADKNSGSKPSAVRARETERVNESQETTKPPARETEREETTKPPARETERVNESQETTKPPARGKEENRTKQTRMKPKNKPNFPPEHCPVPIILLKRPKTVVDHSYHDYSRLPLPDYSEGGESSEIENMSFPAKVHAIMANKDYRRFIDWMPHGRAFRIIMPKGLELKVLPKFFNHSRYSTFLRQLNNNGFKHISQGRDRNCFYHEAFLRDLPHLARFMPAPKNRRRLAPDPDNEPDFYKISERYPLPEVLGTPPVTSTEAVGQVRHGNPSHAECAEKPPSAKPSAPLSQEGDLQRLNVLPGLGDGNDGYHQQLLATRQMILSQMSPPLPLRQRLDDTPFPSIARPQSFLYNPLGTHAMLSCPTQGSLLRPSLSDGSLLMAAIAENIGATERILGVSAPQASASSSTFWPSSNSSLLNSTRGSFDPDNLQHPFFTDFRGRR